MKNIFFALLLNLIFHPGFGQCAANFSITSNTNGAVTFSNTSVGANPNCQYYWHFGDAASNFVIGNVQQTHSYYNGVYTAILMLNDTISACTSSISTTFTVNTAPCTGIINDVYLGQQQNGYCSFYPDISGIDPLSYFSWNFSDGFSSTGYYINHTFTTGGVYTLTLTASDALGVCNYTFLKTFSVTVAPCALTPSFTYTLGANGLVTFQSTSTGTSPGTTYHWDFGDFNGAYGSSVSHTYLNAGSYNVTLQVHDSVNFTCVSSVSQLVNYTACVNQLSFYMYKDSTQLPSIVWEAFPSYAQNTTSVVWNWGDGTSTIGSMYPSHTYTTTGTFSICVTTTVNCGTVNTYCLNSNIFKMSESLQGPATVNVSQTVTGIKQPEQSTSINAYPNPMTDELIIEVSAMDGKLTYILMDAPGRTVLTGSIDNPKTTLNTSSLARGFYNLSITNEVGYSLKIIKLVK